MRKILVVLVVAAVLVLALSVPAMAVPEPTHQYPGAVTFWTQLLKGPVPIDTGDPVFGTINQLGKDIIPINKTVFAPGDNFDNYGQWVASLTH
jgi:hypothetical protein